MQPFVCLFVCLNVSAGDSNSGPHGAQEALLPTEPISLVKTFYSHRTVRKQRFGVSAVKDLATRV